MRSIIFSLAIVVLAVHGAKEVKEAKEAPAAGHYGVPPVYQNPGQASSQYGAPVFNFPNFDVNYCSVHASFPLVGLDKKHYKNRVKRQAYGVPAQETTGAYGAGGAYSQGPAYGPAYFQRPRPFERQACRHTAITSTDACNKCCAISSKVSGSDSPTVGILMVFDPKLTAAPKYHRKYDDDDEDDDDDETEKDKKEQKKDELALQCVCCTSRKI
ncbi:unnamed protein product [Caenorhabditis bovis]|uniref:CX domain-containing protein n=1 Tax=Caenorhabditis bovis TaxID=2654633 RepID=A0A8S1F601_9PELO|nr:unnamed protein product [Caenorhabditis bovis]